MNLCIHLLFTFSFHIKIKIYTFAGLKTVNVSLMDEYVIPFYGLKEGIHEYDFVVKASFFEHYDNPDIPAGTLHVSVELDKKPGLLDVKFIISGQLEVLCDRCLETFQQNIEVHERLFFRFGDEFRELADNLIVLPKEETRLNIANYIYEFAVLNMPIQKFHSENIHGESDCNPEMIEKLNKHRSSETNKSDDIDPRWEKLKNILKNNN